VSRCLDISKECACNYGWPQGCINNLRLLALRSANKASPTTCDILALIAEFEGSVDVASIANRKIASIINASVLTLQRL